MRGQPKRAVRRNVPARLAEDKEAIFSALPKASGKQGGLIMREYCRVAFLGVCLAGGWTLLGATGCRPETPATPQALNGEEVLQRFETLMSRAKTVRAAFGRRSYLCADVGGPRFFSISQPEEFDGTDTGDVWVADGKALHLELRRGGHSASNPPGVSLYKVPSWWLEGYHLPFYLLVMPGAIRERFEIVKCVAEEMNGEPMYVLHGKARKNVVSAKLQAWKEAGGCITARRLWGLEPQFYENMYVWFFFSRESGLLRGMGGAWRSDIRFFDVKLDAALKPELFAYKLPEWWRGGNDVVEDEKPCGQCDSFFKLFLAGKGEEAYRDLTSAGFRQGQSLEEVKAIVGEGVRDFRYLSWSYSQIKQNTAEVSVGFYYKSGGYTSKRVILVKEEDKWLIHEIEP